MGDENRPACEPNEPQAFLDYLEGGLAIDEYDPSLPPIHPNCRCEITLEAVQWAWDNLRYPPFY